MVHHLAGLSFINYGIKKPLLVMHTDIVFDEKHFDNILKSKNLILLE